MQVAEERLSSSSYQNLPPLATSTLGPPTTRWVWFGARFLLGFSAATIFTVDKDLVVLHDVPESVVTFRVYVQSLHKNRSTFLGFSLVETCLELWETGQNEYEQLNLIQNMFWVLKVLYSQVLGVF